MSKADDARELAGYVAPIVRGTSEALLRRRVKTYDRETGEVTGEVTMRQVIGGLAEVTKLEIEVIDGKRPKHFMCDTCGKVFAMPKKGPILKRCDTCRTGGQMVCPCGCGKRPTARASSDAKRQGRTWTCRPESARRFQAARTPEQRSKSGREARDKLTPERRVEISRMGGQAFLAATTPEQRVEGARRAGASVPLEQRIRASRASATRSPEQRSESARKGNATRRARAAVLSSLNGGAEKTGADD